MKPYQHTLIALIVPFAGVFYAARWALRKLSAWRLEQDMTMPASWRRSYAERECLDEMSASLPDPKPWAIPPVVEPEKPRLIDGPVGNYKNVGVR